MSEIYEKADDNRLKITETIIFEQIISLDELNNQKKIIQEKLNLLESQYSDAKNRFNSALELLNKRISGAQNIGVVVDTSGVINTP